MTKDEKLETDYCYPDGDIAFHGSGDVRIRHVHRHGHIEHTLVWINTGKSESYDYRTDSRHPRQGKVEGTLIYRKGCIYTSDNQPLSISDSKMYFSPKQVRIYMRNSKVFSTGNSIATIGAGGGLGGALGFMAADASSGREDSFAAVLTASAVVAVAVIVPCTLVGVPMMIKGKARLKRLVRDYNSKYLFAE